MAILGPVTNHGMMGGWIMDGILRWRGLGFNEKACFITVRV